MHFPGLISAAFVLATGLLAGAAPARAEGAFAILGADAWSGDVARFNAADAETVATLVPNAAAADWLTAGAPRFACPDPQVQEIYRFRWWSLRKHLIRTPAGGYAFTEFLTRTDPISSAVGHHVMEGRWLRDPRYIDEYARFWLRGGPGGALNSRLHNYSEWLADALYQRSLVSGDTGFTTAELDDLVRDYRQWELERALPNGLFWQYDVRGAMEESISGSRTRKNIRPPLNSYQFGNARAIAAIARTAGRDDLAREFEAKAERLRTLVERELWDPAAGFFKVRLEDPPGDYARLSDAREELGFIPWYFELPERGRGYEAAWAQLTDEHGFAAPFGLTTAERRHPRFRSHGTGTCEWDGAVWPFATSQTLTALGNVLRDYPAAPVGRRDWFNAFLTYTRSQYADGRPYVGEYLDETTGAWIKVKKPERSRYYNHSTYADLVIAQLVGLRPRPDDRIEVAPLLPPGTWDWFCLDGVRYHGRDLAIVWDRDGRRFGIGRGLTVLCGGKVIARGDSLDPVTGRLP